jgi:hypothetical protein
VIDWLEPGYFDRILRKTSLRTLKAIKDIYDF